MQRLTAAQIKPLREQMLAKQGGVCAITRYPLTKDKAVLDHCHKTGHVRGVLQRGVNALLGKLENNHERFGCSHAQMLLMLSPAGQEYLKADYSRMPIHHTFRTEDEKRLRSNARARKAYAAKKVAK